LHYPIKVANSGLTARRYRVGCSGASVQLHGAEQSGKLHTLQQFIVERQVGLYQPVPASHLICPQISPAGILLFVTAMR
jgi:hypothetical protein